MTSTATRATGPAGAPERKLLHLLGPAFVAAVAPIDDEQAAAALLELGERHDVRMRRVLAAYRRTIQAQAARLAGHPVASFAVPVVCGRDDVREVDIKAVIGRGDDGEIVLTFLLPGED